MCTYVSTGNEILLRKVKSSATQLELVVRRLTTQEKCDAFDKDRPSLATEPLRLKLGPGRLSPLRHKTP